MKFLKLIIYGLIFFSIFFSADSYSNEYKINLKNSTIGEVNKNIFGMNVLGYNYEEGVYSRGKQISMQGSGLWNHIKKQPVDSMIYFLKNIGAKSLRWPGGCGVHNFDWKKTVGPIEDRPNQAFGLPEFLQCAKRINAIPIITLSDYWEKITDFSDLVEYLNSPVGYNINGGIDWAKLRSDDGHHEPYNVIYFEFGNETYHGDHKGEIINIDDYISKYKTIYKSMKAVDSKIKVGAVLKNDIDPNLSFWTKEIIEKTHKISDYYIHHAYLPNFHADIPSGKVENWDGSKKSTEKLFKRTFAVPLQFDLFYKSLNDFIFSTSGKKIPIAVTEFNGHFVQSKPLPYRFTIGNAILIADLLQIFLKIENNIDFANYWHFSNEYWGMIHGYIPKYNYEKFWQFSNEYWGVSDHKNNYLKHPTYYIYELYNKYLGDSIVNLEIYSDCYRIDGGQSVIPFDDKKIISREIYEKPKKINKDWVISHKDSVDAKQLLNGYLHVNINSEKSINYFHSFIVVPVIPDANYKIKAEIKTSGIEKDRGVRIDIQEVDGYRPNSWSASNEVKSNTWKSVEVKYSTKNDQNDLKIIARRVNQNIYKYEKCQFWIRNITIEKIPDYNGGKVPYISAISSKKGENNYSIFVINRNLSEIIPLEISSYFNIAHAWAESVYGPNVDATNIKKLNNCINKNLPLSYQKSNIFIDIPPASLTAIIIEK